MLEHNHVIMDLIRLWGLTKAHPQVHHRQNVPAVIHDPDDVTGSLSHRGESWQPQNFPDL